MLFHVLYLKTNGLPLQFNSLVKQNANLDQNDSIFVILDPEDVGLPSNNKKPNSRGAERAPLINDATVRLSDLNNPVKNRVQGSQTSTFLELLCPVILPNFSSLCVGLVRFSVASAV